MSFAGEDEVKAEKRATGFLFETIRIDGRDYDYAVYVPRNYEERDSWPVILFLHGLGESGTDGAKQISQGLGRAIMQDPERWPFVVVFPQKPDREEWENHEEAVMAMLEKTEKEYRIDSDRRYLTGLSQGGHGTMIFGARHSDLWAAMVPVCGYPEEKPDVEGLEKMPIWAFHGDADRAVSVGESEKFADAVKAIGGSVKLTIYPGVGHNSWDRAYAEKEIVDWFLSHSRSDRSEE